MRAQRLGAPSNENVTIGPTTRLQTRHQRKYSSREGYSSSSTTRPVAPKRVLHLFILLYLRNTRRVVPSHSFFSKSITPIETTKKLTFYMDASYSPSITHNLYFATEPLLLDFSMLFQCYARERRHTFPTRSQSIRENSKDLWTIFVQRKEASTEFETEHQVFFVFAKYERYSLRFPSKIR